MTQLNSHQLARIASLINQRIDGIKDNIANGSMKTMDQYREQVGVIRGLMQLEEIVNIVIKEGETR